MYEIRPASQKFCVEYLEFSLGPRWLQVWGLFFRAEKCKEYEGKSQLLRPSPWRWRSKSGDGLLLHHYQCSPGTLANVLSSGMPLRMQLHFAIGHVMFQSSSQIGSDSRIIPVQREASSTAAKVHVLLEFSMDFDPLGN
jgi:hypothetical protein